MIKLIIDAAKDKIFLMFISDDNIQNVEHANNKLNYEKLSMLINDFLMKNRFNLKDLSQIYVNRGPGSYAGLRNSISIVKAIYLSKKIDYYSYSYSDFRQKENNVDRTNNHKNLRELPNLCDKFNIKKIRPGT